MTIIEGKYTIISHTRFFHLVVPEKMLSLVSQRAGVIRVQYKLSSSFGSICAITLINTENNLDSSLSC